MATVNFSNDVEGGTRGGRKYAQDDAGLSQSATIWDIDGDGKLDETELALKKMDSSKQGTLTKQQMYQIMQQNLQVKEELSSMKKIVIALVGFTCVLALANVGVSFAAAFLAQDTKTQNGRLMPKSGEGGPVGTAAIVDKVDLGDKKSRRRLCTLGYNELGNMVKTCDISSGWIVSSIYGETITEGCEANHVVKLTWQDAQSRALTEREICPHKGHSIEYINKGDGGLKLHFYNPIGKVSGDPPIVIEKVESGEYAISGLDAIPDLNEECTEDLGCPAGMTCVSPSVCTDGTCDHGRKYCKSEPGEFCTATSDCALSTLMCSDNVCKGYNGHVCVKGNAMCATYNTCVNADDPGADLAQMETGICQCDFSAGCDSGLICGAICGQNGYHKRCEKQERFDTQCSSVNGAGWKCNTEAMVCFDATQATSAKPSS